MAYSEFITAYEHIQEDIWNDSHFYENEKSPNFCDSHV
jgi:hypothetical protein